jgi:hypothetical protein
MIVKLNASIMAIVEEKKHKPLYMKLDFKP